jgi:hypothetical protein
MDVVNGGDEWIDRHPHHRLVHEGGWDVQVLDDGAFRFLKPNVEALAASSVPERGNVDIEPGKNCMNCLGDTDLNQFPFSLLRHRISNVRVRNAQTDLSGGRHS